MPRSRSISKRATWLAAAVVAIGCRDAAPAPSLAAHMHATDVVPLAAKSVTGEVAAQIARLRALTARFHDFDVAKSEGWSTQITACFDNPGVGGMGFHYGNTALIDGTADASQPELLLYEPQKNGRLRLVAVEYIVPFTAWTGSEPPQLYGQSFARNEAFGIWALHVWHARHNPRGMFADWNPKVTCENAPS